MNEKTNLVSVPQDEYLEMLYPEHQKREKDSINEFGVSQLYTNTSLSLNPDSFMKEDGMVQVPIEWMAPEAISNLTSEQKKNLDPDALEEALGESQKNKIETEFDTSLYCKFRGIQENELSKTPAQRNPESTLDSRRVRGNSPRFSKNN